MLANSAGRFLAGLFGPGANSITDQPQKNISSASVWRKCFFPALLAFAFLSGCKDSDEVGLTVLPESDPLSTAFSDTATIDCRVLTEDSVRGDELSASLLGAYGDPVFGKTKASIYAEVLLQGSPTFVNLSTVDSLVLQLFYSGYYADTTTAQTVTVYRLKENINPGSTYYSFKDFAREDQPIGTRAYVPQPYTRIVVDSDTVSPQLRIPLDLALANEIVSLSGQPALSGNSSWRNYFKGIYIESEGNTASGKGCISTIDVFNSRLNLYYHDTTNTARVYQFTLTGGRVNRFEHEFGELAVGRQLRDSTDGDSLTYLQSMSGTKIKISMPFLKHFKDSGSIVVNKAELNITLTDGSTNGYPAPANLLVLALDESGNVGFPLDYFETSGYYGGGLDATTRTYRFNLARQVQAILDDRIGNNGFYLVISGSGVQAARAILGSGKNVSDRMKLKLYYTKLP